MAQGEPTLSLGKRKALPKLQCHPATCPGTAKHPFIIHPSPCQPDIPGIWLLGSPGAPGPAPWLKGRGANPALSCPQLPCAHRGSWGALCSWLLLQGGTLMERRDRDFSLLETEGQGKVVALSRDLSGATPTQAHPETPAVRISALIFSPTHTSNS